MKLYDLKVNHLINPLGFRMKRTVFSWKVTESKGKAQSEARIVVAADEKLTKLVADTGFVPGLKSTGQQVDVEIKPYTRYYWTVMVKSDAGETATGETQYFETAKIEEPWEGKWITCDNTEKRHPVFHKEFSLEKQVESARLYICGLGLYEASLNGMRIGEEYLTPYSNDYKEWVQYQTFDLTEALQKEKQHHLSVMLGNGWYKARFGFAAWDEKGFYGDEWKLIAELRITYTDGTVQTIGTDTSWEVTRSNITFSNLYDGEHVDMTLSKLPTEAARECEAPEGELMERLSLPVTIHEEFYPVELIHTPKDELVFDMGQEFTGLFALRVKEPAGTVIHIQTGEILQNGCFYNENLRSAKSEYYFVTDGEEHTIIPHFTFFGYRYVKVSGVSDLKKEDFKGMALYSDLEFIGTMETGHVLVNRLIKNVQWGLKSNFVDVPTDCPQRDERMGWTGDAQVFSPTALYLSDAYAFYTKYLYDMAKEQSALNGKIPDVVPSVGVETTASVWGDSSCIIPWNMYLFTGDSSILEDQYESMKGWVEYIRGIDGEDHGWRKVFHYGDWLALDNTVTGAEQVMGGTDESFIADVYYAQSAKIVSKAAEVLGKKEESLQYQQLADKIREGLICDYITRGGRCAVNTQTGVVLALKHHLSDREDVLKAQLKRLFEDTQGKLRTGFVGTPILNPVLSENGFDELAYELLLNEEFPGWLREVKLGATTVWERWNSLLDDGTISGIGMNSMNHYAYGSILEWMFRYAAGINTVDEAPGVTEVKFMPTLNLELGHMDASYDSAAGRYEMHWELLDDRHVKIKVSVPFGCKAALYLPLWNEKALVSENPIFEDHRDHICYLSAGTYEVEYELSRSVKAVYDLDTPVWKMQEDPQLKELLEGWVSYVAIPDQFRLYSLRNMIEKFPANLKVSGIEEVEKALSAYNKAK